MLGTRLGPYHIENELGSGGMGCVYQARVVGEAPELERGARVALKIIHPHLLETPDCFKRFLLEARLGQRVRHENVVSTYDCDAIRIREEHHHFLVMEHVQGQTLRALLDELGTVPEELCRHIGRQIASGLRAIHEAGAVHRDLKPENVLVTSDHEVKIMDLGVARLLGDPLRLSRTGHFVGSILYAPPEAFHDAGGELDERADLHSLGVLLYEVATGRHPYRHRDVEVVLHRILHETPTRAGERNPQLSPFIEETIHTLCAKKAGDRFDSAAELLEVLTQGEQSEWWQRRARLLARRPRRPLRRTHVHCETALHGRTEELAALLSAYEAAREGDGRVLLFEGEAGVGKTRLIEEFIARLDRSGEDLNYLYGSYPPGGAATVTGAFSTAFREQFGAADLETTLAPYLATTPVMVPAFASLLRGEPPPSLHEPLTKESLQTLFIHATHGLARERPTIVLIDDLHFAPSEGRALFAALALAVPGHRVLLVGTMRPGVPTPWRAEVERLEHATGHDLRRLGPKDLASLLVDAFRSERLAAGLGHEIARKSDGNPFFVFEILHALRDAGQIKKAADGSWVTTEAVTVIRVPSSIVDMVQARLAGLEESDASLLEVAACCGYRFDPLLLAEVLEVSELDVLRRLSRIERKHQLVRSTGRVCAFDHHQVQEFLYAGLSDLLRERYHGKIADALLARAALDRDTPGKTTASEVPLTEPLWVEVCTHALEGGRPDAARAYLEPALAHLEDGYLNASAVTLADAALALPGLLQGEERCRVLLRKAERLSMIGRRAEQRAALDEAEPLARGTALESRLCQQRGDYCNTTARYEEARAWFEQARATAEARGDERDLTASLGRLGSVHAKLGDMPRAREHFESSMALARTLGNRQAEGVSSGNLGLACIDIGRYDEGARLLGRHLALAEESGNLRSQSIAMGNLGLIYADWGRPDEARAYLTRKLEIARKIGDRMGEAVATANLGMTLHSLGRFDEARTSYEHCVRIAREIGAREGEANAAGNLGMIHYSLGHYAKAADSYERAVAISHEIGDGIAEGDALSNLGTLQISLGKGLAARKTLGRALGLLHKSNSLRPKGYTLHGLALEAEERDALEHAQELYAQAIHCWERMGAKEALAETQVARGRLAIQQADWNDAAANLDAALELARSAQVPGTTLLATALSTRLPGADVDAAQALLAESRGRVGAAEWMEAQFRLFQAGAGLPSLEEARRTLAMLLANAPADCRSSMREHVRLHREILAASVLADDAPVDVETGLPTSKR